MNQTELVIGMGLHVPVCRVLPPEGLATYVADERLLSSVDALVNFQMTLLPEGNTTIKTFVSLIPGPSALG